MSTLPDPLPLLWKDCKQLYPTCEEIVVALQDLGERKKEKKKKKEYWKTKWPLIERLATKIYNSINEIYNKPEGLTKNVTRGKMPLVQELVTRRKHTDLIETDTFFHKYGKDNKVFIITNNTETCGIEIAINAFQEHIKQQIQQRSIVRTGNDGLRAACIMLDPDHREAVAGILSKKKDRKKSDQTDVPILNFYEKLVSEYFLNPGYICAPPKDEYYDVFPEEEKGAWDPNDPSIFEHERTGAWLKATWDEYVRPKYKTALDAWSKKPDGEDGSPPSFIEYTQGYRWLVYIYCKDLDANLLLASNTGGRKPDEFQVEAGFEEEPTSSSKRNAIDDGLQEAKRQRTKIDVTLQQQNEVEKRELEVIRTKLEIYEKLVDVMIKLKDDPDGKEDYDTFRLARSKLALQISRANFMSL